jgi:hypothetical protein
MAGEIWDLLESGTVDNAANLMAEDQLASISQWVCAL